MTAGVNTVCRLLLPSATRVLCYACYNVRVACIAVHRMLVYVLATLVAVTNSALIRACSALSTTATFLPWLLYLLARERRPTILYYNIPSLFTFHALFSCISYTHSLSNATAQRFWRVHPGDYTFRGIAGACGRTGFAVYFFLSKSVVRFGCSACTSPAAYRFAIVAICFYLRACHLNHVSSCTMLFRRVRRVVLSISYALSSAAFGVRQVRGLLRDVTLRCSACTRARGQRITVL